MDTLKEINYKNDLLSIERGANLLEAELAALKDCTVMVNESDENMLNAILNDAERRIEAARRALADANNITNPEERKAAKSKMMGHLNRTRSLLDKVVKEFFPMKPGEGEEGDAGVKNSRDEFVTPQQAAETLGIHTSKLQSLVMGNKLRMYNHNGKWALKGSEVQQLADQGAASAAQAPKKKPGLMNRLFSK